MSIVHRERLNGLEIIRLDDPSRLNALTAGMRDALGAAVVDFTEDASSRCLIIAGTGAAFCAGGDLRSLAAGQSAEEIARRLERVHSWVQRLVAVEKPVIMAVNAVAAGAGFGLAMLGDFILAAEDAYFVPGFPAVGLAPDFGLAWSLPRAIGATRAKDILLANRRIGAEEAHAIGMITRVVPGNELMSEAVALGSRLADAATLGLGLAKSLVTQSFGMSLPQFFEHEIAAQMRAMSSADGREGIEAFVQKRPPRFTGK